MASHHSTIHAAFTEYCQRFELAFRTSATGELELDAQALSRIASFMTDQQLMVSVVTGVEFSVPSPVFEGMEPAIEDGSSDLSSDAAATVPRCSAANRILALRYHGFAYTAYLLYKQAAARATNQGH